MTRILLIVGLFAVAGLCLFELNARNNIELDYDPPTRVAQLMDEGRYAEARLITQFALENPSLMRTRDERDTIKRLDQEIATELDTAGGKIRRFVKGAVSGEPRDLAGFLGSMSLDLFVVGDIRDLIVQGGKEIRSQDGDKIIMALSAAGLATTLAPQIDWAPSLMKGFRRVGALSERFVKSFGKLCRNAIKVGDYKSVARVTENFGTAARKIGPGPMMGVMKRVDDPGALARIARASEINPRATYMVATADSGKAISRLQASGSNVATLAKRIKVSSRFLKQMRKGTMIIPTRVLQVIAVVAFLLAVWLLVRLLVVRPFTSRRRR